MITDSITTNASIASAPQSKDFAKKKKKANRSAKLKQCKLDARREQWLSQVSMKDKRGREEKMYVPQPLSMHTLIESNASEGSLENLELMAIEGSKIHRNESDSELSCFSVSNSPTSILLGGSESGTNLTGSSRSSGSSSSSSSSSGGCCSGNTTEDEEGAGDDDDGTLDDWEAVADALAAIDNHRNQHQDHNNGPTSPSKPDSFVQLDPPCEIPNRKLISALPIVVSSNVASSRAWRSDNEFRPLSLPNLSKQHSFPAADWHFPRAGVPWAYHSALNAPTSCPICCEDLDPTDSTFLPCMCGFHLCLFCHKRILDEDGRCPGCRKPYELDSSKAVAFKLGRSCSMIARS